MRRLVLALLLLNLLYLLWSAVRPAPDESVPAREFPESLVLLGELDRPLPVVAPPSERCVVLGPFASEADLSEFAATHMADRAWRVDVQQQSLPAMHRVFVRSPASGAQGPALLASIRDAIAAAELNVDSYLVASGDLDGAVSLGLFVEQRNARRVYEQILGLGLTVEMQTEARTRNLYSIVMAGDEDSDFIQETVLARQATDVQVDVTEKLCEMIALPD